MNLQRLGRAPVWHNRRPTLVTNASYWCSLRVFSEWPGFAFFGSKRWLSPGFDVHQWWPILIYLSLLSEVMAGLNPIRVSTQTGIDCYTKLWPGAEKIFIPLQRWSRSENGGCMKLHKTCQQFTDMPMAEGIWGVKRGSHMIFGLAIEHYFGVYDSTST